MWAIAITWRQSLPSSLVVVNNLSELFSSDTIWPIDTKLGINVSWGILHRTDVGIFDSLKNMAALTKNRTKGSDSIFSHTSPKPLCLAKFWQWVKVFSVIYLWCNFRLNLCSHVRVIALFQCFLLFLMLFLSKIFTSDTIWPIWTKLGMSVPLGILHRTGLGIFYLSKIMAVIT